MTEKLSRQEARNVLSAWTALEVLSPQSFNKKEDLTAGNKKLIADFVGDYLPWEQGGEQLIENTKLFYQVIIGTINFRKAASLLLKKYSDDNAELPATSEQSIIAVVLIDQNGRLIKDVPSVAISSFAWGVPKALQGNLKELSAWTNKEPSLLEGLDEFLRRIDENGNYVALTKNILNETYRYLLETLKLPSEITAPNFFAVKVYERKADAEPPLPLLLNSFYLNDLIKADSFIEKKVSVKNLEKYLGITIPDERKFH